MYRVPRLPKTSITHNASYEGEMIEEKIERIFSNREPITDGAPIIYTDRAEGVKPEYDVRTDRFDLALEMKSTETAARLAKRQERHEAKVVEMQKKSESDHSQGSAEPKS